MKKFLIYSSVSDRVCRVIESNNKKDVEKRMFKKMWYDSLRYRFLIFELGSKESKLVGNYKEHWQYIEIKWQQFKIIHFDNEPITRTS